MSPFDELLWTRADVIDHLRQGYAALGWSLRRVPGTTRTGHPCTLFYASTARGRFAAGQGETIWKDSPVAALEAVLAHPSTRAALSARSTA